MSLIGRLYTPEYYTWAAMIQRCTNPNTPSYKSYGGQGITVSEDWKDFEKFYEDMGDRPDGYSIERIDSHKGYYKENCKWIPLDKQCENRRNNVLVKYNNKIVKLVSLKKRSVVRYDILLGRVRNGWEVKKALTTPVRSRTTKTDSLKTSSIMLRCSNDFKREFENDADNIFPDDPKKVRLFMEYLYDKWEESGCPKRKLSYKRVG